MTLQIEAGKYYRNRDGRKVGPMQYSGAETWPWIVEVGDGKCWHDDGREAANTKSGDLIAEWRDETPAHIITHEGREHDLTALETPFGILQEKAPLVAEALQAWPHGIEIFTGLYWSVCDRPLWVNYYAYRAKPAPVEERVPCQRGLSAFLSEIEFGTCIKRADGSID